jgi:hypothetical protein
MLERLAEEFIVANPAYSLVGRAEGGLSSGALILRDSNGEWVFKKLHNPLDFSQAQVRLAKQVRLRGYPLADFAELIELPSGIALLQRRITGDIRMDLTMPMAQEMVRLNKLLIDVEPIETLAGFGELLLQTTTEGNDDYCSHTPLQTHSDESRRILEWIRSVGFESQSLRVPETDAVHYDFHHLNVLWHDDHATVVIDWDGSRIGDRVFDLVTLAVDANELTSGDVMEFLKAEILGGSSRDLVRLYVAHMGLRVCVWNIVNQPAEKTVRRVAHVVQWIDWANKL